MKMTPAFWIFQFMCLTTQVILDNTSTRKKKEAEPKPKLGPHPGREINEISRFQLLRRFVTLPGVFSELA